MSVIALFNGIFCKEDAVIQQVVKKTGYTLVTDKDLVAEATELSGMAESKIERVFSGKTSVFNKFTHERERSVASLRLALAKRLTGGNLLIAGFVGQLIPKEVTHVLRVCLIADMKYRVSMAMKQRGISEKDATKLVHRHDEDCTAWMNTLFQTKDPWDPSLYDMVLPTHKKTAQETATLICDYIDKDVLTPTEASRQAVDNVLLAAKVEVGLAKEGHNVNVSARDGAVTLTINKQVLMLHRLEEELMSIAQSVEGVRSVETRVGKDFYQTDIYRKYDFEMPSKVLLVDDEREFVETLSERLIMRRMGSAVAYDGESALDLIREDEPEVMILDLKMPGIDGIEVLRQVKATRPEIEVIILTGHGSEADRDVCMELGAFAYLNKPVDIDLLSDTLRRANEKIKDQKGGTR